MNSQGKVIALRWRHLWGLKLPLKCIIFVRKFWHEDSLTHNSEMKHTE